MSLDEIFIRLQHQRVKPVASRPTTHISRAAILSAVVDLCQRYIKGYDGLSDAEKNELLADATDYVVRKIDHAFDDMLVRFDRIGE